MQKFLRIVLLAALAMMPLATNAQYCTPSPTSKDGNGITNVTFGVGDETVISNVTWSSSPYYIDNSSQIGAVPAGTTCEMSITFATGYSYGAIIWVDWNNDQTFSGTEVVWVGEAPNTNPTTLAVNFDIAPSQDTGSYRMRICAADSYFDSYTSSIAAAANANPCAEYSWGVGLDYTLHILSAPTCTRPEGLNATDVNGDGLTLNWVDTMNTGATYSIDYWKDGGDTNTVTSTTTSYTFTGLDANSLYHFVVKAVCSASDESLPLGGSFATGCNGSSCDLTVSAWGGYSDSYYSPTLTIFQNGRQLATVNNGTETVSVCSSDPVAVLFADATYTWNARYASVYDGGGTELFNGSTDNFSTGDTLLTITSPCPTCIPPTALTAVPDSNEILFSWTPRSGASQFIVYLNDVMIADNVTDTFYTFTNLPANTAYTLGVQSVCSSDDSSNIASMNTRTACGTITLPYFVDFEDAAFNGAWYPCWDSVIHAGTDPSVNTVAQHNSTYGMYFQGNSSENYNLVVSPLVPTAGNNIYVRFWGYLTATSGWMKAGVMTDPHDTTTFIPMVNIVGNSWNEYEFRTDTLDADATYYIAWMACIPGASYNTQIGRVDDIYISEAPSCARVPVAYIDTTTSESITIRWDDNGMDSYTVYYWADGSADTLYESTTDTVVTISGLEPMTQYWMMVVANCSDGDAEPSPIYSAGTTCADATCNFTFNMTDSWGDGWNGNAIQIYQAGVLVGEATISSGNSAVEIIEVCSSAPAELRFVLGSYPTEMGGTIVDGGGNTVFTIESMNSYTTGSVLATVTTPCPDCVPPTDLTVSDILPTEATVSWTPQDGQSSWIVRLDSTDVTVTVPYYTFTNLDVRSTHTVSVATDCSDDTSAFISTTFTTDCLNGSCDITVTSDADYIYSNYYSPTLHVWQNGVEVTNLNGTTQTVNVCSGMPVIVTVDPATYDWDNPRATIIDGGEEILFDGSTAGYMSGDTLVVTPNACPTCLKPTGLMVSVIDSTSLEFEWDVADTVAGYLVSFNGGAWENASAGAYSAVLLNPNTAYTISVVTLCSASDTSNPRTLTVKTACGQMVVPYANSFEDDAQGTVPSCWTVVRPGYGGFPGVSGSAYTGSNGMTLAADFNDSTTIASSLVPLNGDEIYVSFWASVNQGNTLYAGVMTDLAYDTTFIPLLTVPYNNSTYTLYEFNTSTLSPYDQYYVAFRLVTGASNHYADLDDIEIRLDEGCMYPANLSANPGAHNVVLTWSNSTSTPNFVVEYQQTGATTWEGGYTTTDTTYNVTGLNAAISYDFRVGYLCNTDTLWSYITMPTTCDLMALPYSENFDAYANDVMPPCWEWNTSFCTHWDGGVFLRTYHGGGSEYVVLPQLDGNITKLQIEFDCKVGTIAEQDGILFGVADAAGVLISWLDTIQDPNHSRNAHVHHILNMLNYSVPGSAARIAFAQYRNWGEWALIDNINITQLPDCYPVDSLEAHNLIDPDHTSFTWASLGTEAAWQVYVDTVTANIDSIPDSLFTEVYSRYYEIPMGTIHGGGIYTFYVRSNCGADQSNWNSVTFGAGTYIMNNSSTADTVVACGLVVYDNGGPIAGYLPNSNSALVIRSENAGSELEVFGGIFGWGSSAATLNIYDGEGTSGSVLYTYSTIDGRDTLSSVLATSTTGALTITFVANGTMCHTGYELYIHCIGSALCERPTQLNGVMTGVGEANVTWSGSSAAYELQYKLSGDSIWNTLGGITTESATLTSLLPDTTYDLQVIGICGSDTSTPSFPAVLNTHFEVVITPCDPVADVTVSDITNNSAIVSWTSTADQWEIKLTNVSGDQFITVTDNPHTLTNLLPNMQYAVRVRTLCSGTDVEPESEWSDGVAFTTLQNAPTTYTLTVTANNSEWGTVTGGGNYYTGTEVTITATPNDGYYFDRWNDGDTNATRIVTVTADVTYTANFAPNGSELNYYTITVLSNNNAWGTVSGGGEYVEGSQATITATPNDGYHFVEWQDGNTDNPRTFTVIEPATFTATFAANVGIDDLATSGSELTIFPNPATTNITVGLNGFEGEVIVSVVDLNGRTVYTAHTTESTLLIPHSSLSAGAYFVRVTSSTATAVSKLIVK